MLSYEESLAILLGWIERHVSVTIVPDYDGAMQVAMMSGVLRRGTAHSAVEAVTGHPGEVLFFYVGEDYVDGEPSWQRRSFALTRDQFVGAYMTSSAITGGGEMLVISHRLVNTSIWPVSRNVLEALANRRPGHIDS
jgi:hypothetical protein